MFNIQPGQGLGFIGSREIAFGLGWILQITGIILIVDTEYESLSIESVYESILIIFEVENISIKYGIEPTLKLELESRGINYVRNSL